MDRFGRTITYLRVSLTEHCNFRCRYCSPAEGTPHFAQADHLQPEELDAVLTLFAGWGLRHVRFTGGEPLIYPWLEGRLRHASALGIPKVSISTNGYLLERLAGKIRAAGVSRLNVSLDSLDPALFADITRGGDVARVLRGLQSAKAAGFERIKLNVVLLRHRNFREIGNLLDYALAQDFDIQFIETMPLGQAGGMSLRDEFVPAGEARQVLERRHPLEPVASDGGSGPARQYQIAGRKTRIGFISAISENFCAGCNRVRLSANGRVVYCLGQEAGFDLLPLLRQKTDPAVIAALLRDKIWHEKPERHYFTDNPEKSGRVFMMRLGG